MSSTNIKKIKWLILSISVLFIGLGIYRGESDAVFSKAVNICMECIGIG